MQARDITIEQMYNIFLDANTLVNPFGATMQCIHESSSGGKPFASSLALQANNLTGMKVGSWDGEVVEKKTWEQKPNGEKYMITTKFRAFKTVEEFTASYSKMVDKSYPRCAKDNFLGYFSGFSKGRMGAWATDINYFKKLLQIAWKYSPLFFKDPKAKWKAVLVNASERNLFVLPEHEEIAVKFLQEVLSKEMI